MLKTLPSGTALYTVYDIISHVYFMHSYTNPIEILADALVAGWLCRTVHYAMEISTHDYGIYIIQLVVATNYNDLNLLSTALHTLESACTGF